LIDLLGFKGFKEAFHRRVVIAVAFAAHAWQTAVLAQSILEEQAGELRATIAMHDQATFGLPQGDCLIESVDGQSGVNFGSYSPSNDFA
jgi:hypothetical protein